VNLWLHYKSRPSLGDTLPQCRTLQHGGPPTKFRLRLLPFPDHPFPSSYPPNLYPKAHSFWKKDFLVAYPARSLRTLWLYHFTVFFQTIDNKGEANKLPTSLRLNLAIMRGSATFQHLMKWVGLVGLYSVERLSNTIGLYLQLLPLQRSFELVLELHSNQHTASKIATSCKKHRSKFKLR